MYCFHVRLLHCLLPGTHYTELDSVIPNGVSYIVLKPIPTTDFAKPQSLVVVVQ